MGATITEEISREQVQETETRGFAGDIELREADGKPAEVFGYALKWGVRYNVAWFTEEIQRGALDEANISDVRILFNHDPNQIIGRTKSGTAQVGFDETGMWYRSTIPNSPFGENLKESLKRGDVTQSSWAFSIARDSTGRSIGDQWDIKDGKEHRIITKVSTVYDASPVTYPANPDTTAAKRSLDIFKQETRQETTDNEGLAKTYELLARTLELKQAIYQHKNT